MSIKIFVLTVKDNARDDSYSYKWGKVLFFNGQIKVLIKSVIQA